MQSCLAEAFDDVITLHCDVINGILRACATVTFVFFSLRYSEVPTYLLV